MRSSIAGGGPSINLYLVTWGQNVCRPVYPLCGSCVLFDLCPKIGVVKRVERLRPREDASFERRSASESGWGPTSSKN